MLKYWEHFDGKIEEPTLLLENESYRYDFRKKSSDDSCYLIKKIEGDYHISLSYFIGLDWINKEQTIYIEPKLNKEATQTNYLEMLFSALSHLEIANETDDLFEIKWEKEYISIDSQQDLLTPLLVVKFLRVVQEIVRKGLKKSYYRVEQNLYSKIKGKILVGQTIKQNVLKNKPLNTFCTFDEFGVNGLENRLLKKALVFVRRYLPTLKIPHSQKYTTEMFNYIIPAFDFVSEEVNLNEIKHSKINAFYKEYDDGIRLAKLILKRFGYNITNTQQNNILTPPFWIDMSKLFELYVLGQLKDKYHNQIFYGKKETKAEYGIPDFLLVTENEKMIIDTKYKLLYSRGDYDISDIRQLSGYGRDIGVLKTLGYKTYSEQVNAVVKCLIIYPDQSKDKNLLKNEETEIKEFTNFYKQPIKLPTI